MNLEHRRKKLKSETIAMMKQLVSAIVGEEKAFTKVLVEGITRNVVHMIADGEIEPKRQTEFWNSSLWKIVINFVSDMCDQIESTNPQKEMIVSQIKKLLKSKNIRDRIPPETEFLRVLIASELVGSEGASYKKIRPRTIRSLESTGLIQINTEYAQLSPLVAKQLIAPFKEWKKDTIERYLFSGI